MDKKKKNNPPGSRDSLLEHLVSTWRSGIVARSEIGSFSGGVLHPRTMANRDSAGTGIKPFFRCGRKVFYRTTDVAVYIINQMDD